MFPCPVPFSLPASFFHFYSFISHTPPQKLAKKSYNLGRTIVEKDENGIKVGNELRFLNIISNEDGGMLIRGTEILKKCLLQTRFCMPIHVTNSPLLLVLHLWEASDAVSFRISHFAFRIQLHGIVNLILQKVV